TTTPRNVSSTPVAAAPSAAAAREAKASAPTTSQPPARPQAAGPSAAGAPAASSSPRASSAAAPPAARGGPRGGLGHRLTDAAIDTFRDAFIAEVKRTKGKLFYNTIVMSARRVDIADGRVTFVFGQRPTTLAATFEQQRASLQEVATAIAGRAMEVAATE